jgi:hypothetical protein
LCSSKKPAQKLIEECNEFLLLAEYNKHKLIILTYLQLSTGTLLNTINCPEVLQRKNVRNFVIYIYRQTERDRERDFQQ